MSGIRVSSDITICKICGKQIINKKPYTHFCSRKCYNAFSKAEKSKPRLCLCCGVDISSKPIRSKYCSKQCWSKHYNKEYNLTNQTLNNFKKREKRKLPEEKDKIRKYRRKYVCHKKHTDEFYRFKSNIRLLIWGSFYRKDFKKCKKTEQILGCTIPEFKDHIEKQMPIGKSIKDLGRYGYHIDHKISVATAKTQEDVIKLCHYTNLQPLWWKDNLSKGSKCI